ncbi:ABC transporter substrate-binding protein [Haloplanus sp. GCM10025708]|uniref:ABC transporter substrate-binding protein n=1 Tax=Haloferacaceae TaxID=1644056 RepID=UPI00360DD143
MSRETTASDSTEKGDPTGQSGNTRRRFLKSVAVSTGAVSIAGCTGQFGGGGGAEPIKIGTLYDNSGPMGFVGKGKDAATKMWLEEQNHTLLDREVEWIDYNPAGDNTKYKNLTRKLIQQDDVDMIFGALLSSNREALRPIVDENKQLFSYNGWYEGGVCDEFMVLNTTLTSQQRPLIDFMVENFGSDYYALVADYNYGRVSNRYARHYAQENGAEPVGEEFIPLEVSEFGSTINRIKEEDPDWILSLLVGSSQLSFFKQAESAGVDLPYGSLANIAGTYEHVKFEPPVMSDTYSCFSYFQEIPTERNRQFVQKFQENNPDYTKENGGYVFLSIADAWNAIRFYWKAVEKAGTVDQQEVLAAYEDGLELESPKGTITFNGETHHATQNMWLAKVNDDHSITFLDQGGNETDQPIAENVQTSEWFRNQCNLVEDSTWDDPKTEYLTPDEGDLA